MLIDPFQENWHSALAERVAALPGGLHVYLLLDGAFVPGMCRSRPFADEGAGRVVLLFASLPGASDAVRDASPFLTPIGEAGAPLPERLKRRLAPCDGLPMVSAIATTERLDELGARLAAWCVVENGGQRFNFRFPDTRRLPGMYAALTPRQRAELCGPMHVWSYIGRDGAWADLDVTPCESGVATTPLLEDGQFGRMVDDCAADEILFRLAYGGFTSAQAHSVLHADASRALTLARGAGLDDACADAWCAHVLKGGRELNTRAELETWLTLFADEELPKP